MSTQRADAPAMQAGPHNAVAPAPRLVRSMAGA